MVLSVDSYSPVRERMIFAHRRSCRLIPWIFYLFEVLDQDSRIIADGEQDPLDCNSDKTILESFISLLHTS